MARRLFAGCTEYVAMAKGQKKSNREAKKPKQEKPKTNASNPSLKGAVSLGEQKKPKL
jgi:hypothetical protein